MRKFAVFNYGHRPVITIDVLGTDGFLHPISAMLDTGNDQTLFTKSTAIRLGFDLENPDGINHVQGVYGEPQPVLVYNDVVMKIGDTEPIAITVFVGETDIDLIGMRDVSRIYDIIFSNDKKITLVQAAPEELAEYGYESTPSTYDDYTVSGIN